MKAADGVQIAERWEPEYGDTVCQVCLRPNPLWFTPNELWNAVVKPQTGVFCPVCFIEFAAASGFDHAWVLLPEGRYDDLSRTEERERVLREALIVAKQMIEDALDNGVLYAPDEKMSLVLRAIATAAPEQGKEEKS